MLGGPRARDRLPVVAVPRQGREVVGVPILVSEGKEKVPGEIQPDSDTVLSAPAGKSAQAECTPDTPGHQTLPETGPDPWGLPAPGGISNDTA